LTPLNGRHRSLWHLTDKNESGSRHVPLSLLWRQFLPTTAKRHDRQWSNLWRPFKCVNRVPIDTFEDSSQATLVFDQRKRVRESAWTIVATLLGGSFCQRRPPKAMTAFGQFLWRYCGYWWYWYHQAREFHRIVDVWIRGFKRVGGQQYFDAGWKYSIGWKKMLWSYYLHVPTSNNRAQQMWGMFAAFFSSIPNLCVFPSVSETTATTFSFSSLHLEASFLKNSFNSASESGPPEWRKQPSCSLWSFQLSSIQCTVSPVKFSFATLLQWSKVSVTACFSICWSNPFVNLSSNFLSSASTVRTPKSRSGRFDHDCFREPKNLK